MSRRASDAIGAVYELVDPRSDEVRYVGSTIKSLEVRLNGHLRAPSPRVGKWIAELAEAGLLPVIRPIREGITVAALDAAEHEEITRALLAGGSLLNEQLTAKAAAILEAQRVAAEESASKAGWLDLADRAMLLFGGPLPPGDLPRYNIPSESWEFICADRRIRSRVVPPSYEEHRDHERAEKHARNFLWWCAEAACGNLQLVAGGDVRKFIKHNHLDLVMRAPSESPADVSRFLILITWYMAAVHPWRDLAERAGLADDEAAFIAWAGRDPEVKSALDFLASRGNEILRQLSHRWHWGQEPGRDLAAVAAAYSDADVSGHVADKVHESLRRIAMDHEATKPMADYLLKINPRALNSVFGPDIAVVVDARMGLEPGLTARILAEVSKEMGALADGAIKRVIDRSACKLPTTELPDYRTWNGSSIPAMQVISAHLARAGLAVPRDGATAVEYVENVRSLWLPDVERVNEIAAGIEADRQGIGADRAAIAAALAFMNRDAA